MMKLKDLPFGTEFKFKDTSVTGGDRIRIKVYHENLYNLECLTRRTVTRTVKKWVEKRLSDTTAGQVFKFGNWPQEAIYKRVFNNTQEHAGQVFWVNDGCSYLYSGKPWTTVYVEEETQEVTEEWV